MLLTVLDGESTPQAIIAKGHESLTARSGSIAATGVSQTLAAANTSRSGMVVQNGGANPMYVNDLGAASSNGGSFMVAPGDYFPPPGYPVSTGAITITGTINEKFTAREW